MGDSVCVRATSGSEDDTCEYPSTFSSLGFSLSPTTFFINDNSHRGGHESTRKFNFKLIKLCKRANVACVSIGAEKMKQISF